MNIDTISTPIPCTAPYRNVSQFAHPAQLHQLAPGIGGRVLISPALYARAVTTVAEQLNKPVDQCAGILISFASMLARDLYGSFPFSGPDASGEWREFEVSYARDGADFLMSLAME